MSTAAQSAQLLAAYAAFRTARSVEDLFAAAAEAAPAATGFDRAIIAAVRDGHLTAAGSRPIGHGPSDELRRRLMADPVRLRPGTEEAEHTRLVRRPRAAGRVPGAAEALGLGAHALAVVAPRSKALALVVVDRARRPPSAADLERVDAFAGLVAIALGHLLLRRQVADLAQEVRQFAGTAQALAAEVRDAPAAIVGEGLVDPRLIAGADAGRGDAADVYGRLSEKERPVARLVAAGRSNREIAAALTLSPETVKSHVASILRKLGVPGRVEAATLLLRAER
ncbi:hypothetical protein DSM112329_04591 [Paraconexibacter sp. AEG42_29]|uniref:HTH luxR-type domain-containing protein n=1 Tax=Paraconexibacter sp. AEG42_29 TaxID=2997339 RepID=A0AAU7B167_9ACTN